MFVKLLKQFFRISRLPLQIIFSAGILWWLVHKLGAQEVLDAFGRTSWGLLGGCVGLYLLAQGLSAWRWWRISLSVRFGGSFGRYLGLYFLGMFYNIFLPSGYGGDVLKVFYQAPLRLGRPSKRMAALTVLMDRLTGFVAILLLGGMASCGLSARAAVEWGLIMSTLFFLMIVFSVGAVWAVSKWKVIPRKLRVIALLIRSKAAEYAAIVLASLVIQLLNVAIYVWIFASLGLNLSMWAVTFGYAVVTLATLLPVSIGGLGVRESGWAALLVGFGAPAAEGVTAGLVYFAVQTICSGFGLWPFLTTRQKPPHEED